jgi:hypothetical protein
MRTLQRVWRGGKVAFFTVAGWSIVYGTALAQGYAPNRITQPKKEPGEFVTSYALVLLAVGLGLVLVCRPSNRRDRARPEQYAESKLTSTDE